MEVPAPQLALLAAVLDANPRTVVVLTNGSVVEVDPWRHHAHALVEAWLLGQAGGGAVADVLLGAVNPSGKLAETMPVALEDNPALGVIQKPNEAGKACTYVDEGLKLGGRRSKLGLPNFVVNP